ncbi:MAG TPA: hypothetical protein VGN20_21490 [Mucilaginibacter sp.]
MKIRTTLLIIIFNLLIVSAAFPQDKEPSVYFKLYGGYGLFTPGSDRLYPGSILGIQSGSTGTYTNSNRGLGGGFNDGFGIEKTLGKFFTIGIDFNYLHGKTLSSNYSIVPPASFNIANINYAGKTAHSVISLIPNLSFKMMTKPNYYLYTRLGLITALKTKYQLTENYDIAGNGLLGSDEVFTQVNKYGLNFGLNTAAGIRFKLWGPIKGNVELGYNLLAVSPNSAMASTNIAEPGQGTYINEQINYVKSNTDLLNLSTTTTTQNSIKTINVVEDQPSITQHINNIVLNIGIAVSITDLRR